MSTTNPFNRYREPMMYNGWRPQSTTSLMAEYLAIRWEKVRLELLSYQLEVIRQQGIALAKAQSL